MLVRGILDSWIVWIKATCFIAYFIYVTLVRGYALRANFSCLTFGFLNKVVYFLNYMLGILP
jgi:hypothetical protein